MKRDFTVPRSNRLWVSDFTLVATRSSFVYIAFVIDVFVRRIVGWGRRPVRRIPDALEQAICDRMPGHNAALIHQAIAATVLVFRYSKRLSDAEIQPSVGRVGDTYDNALAETVIGQFKTEVIGQREPWRG